MKKYLELYAGRTQILCNGKVVFSYLTYPMFITLAFLIAPFILILPQTFQAHIFSQYLVVVIIPILFMFLTMTRDPGILPRAHLNKHPEQFLIPIQHFLAEMIEYPSISLQVSNRQQIFQLCYQCQVYQPENAYHCNRCNNCVLEMDHHCKWLGQCIGKRNYHYFIFFIFTLNCSLFAQIYILFQILTQKNIEIILSLMISAGTLVFTMPLLLYHLYISINKKTTIAHFKENKYIEEFINEYYEQSAKISHFVDRIKNGFKSPIFTKFSDIIYTTVPKSVMKEKQQQMNDYEMIKMRKMQFNFEENLKYQSRPIQERQYASELNSKANSVVKVFIANNDEHVLLNNN